MCQCTEKSPQANQGAEIAREDVALFNRFSRNTLAKLPTEWQIEQWRIDSPSESLIRHYLLEGRLAIEALSAEDLDVEEATALHSFLEQTDRKLAALGSRAVGSSCIGKCTEEKSKCKAGCEAKFCGCLWNAFLCKANCFIAIQSVG